jgi:predicted transcriptional regulator
MMTLKGIMTELDGELLTPGMNLEAECAKLFASDLMSDVLAFIKPGSILMTGLVNSHVVRTARLVEVTAIVVVQGKRPDRKVIDEAREYRVPIIATGCSMFEACSRVAGSFPREGR